MHYAEYSGEEQLKERFNKALDEQQNVVIKADSLTDPKNDFALSVARGLGSNPREL